MPKPTIITKTSVSLVKLTKDSSVDKYSGNEADLNAIITDLNSTSDWDATYSVDEKTHVVNSITSIRYPGVDRHPGHTHNPPPGAWKYQIEEGRGSKDRLVASATGTIERQSTTHDEKLDKYTVSVTISIACSVKVLEDTH